uniref:MAM domain-containing protein 2 n=1 Tax=Magallana gigas TaxID=29159 RepID=K1RM15_MAGGI
MCETIRMFIGHFGEIITLDCAFNADTCSWIQDSADHLDWHRWYGRSPDLTSGPQVDHANTTEYYLLLKGHEAHSGNWTARLYSPHISINSPRNLTFWYHMNGAGIGNLRLYKENADGSNEVLFVKKGRQGVSWEQASVNLPVGFYKLVFEADAARHYSSDLAIDDIRLQDGPPLIG